MNMRISMIGMREWLDGKLMRECKGTATLGGYLAFAAGKKSGRWRFHEMVETRPVLLDQYLRRRRGFS